jgi:hypothetical protein
VVEAVREAFVSALGTGLTIGAAATLAGAAIAFALIRRHPASLPTSAAEREPTQAALEIAA